MKEEKKVIAIIKELDDMEYDFYFNDMIENKDIIIDGGKHYKSYNDEVLSQIKEAYENLYEIDLQYTKECDFFEYYLKKQNGKKWSPAQRKKFINDFHYVDILNIVTNKKYQKTILRGYSQGDEIQVFYNIDDVTQDDLNLLQSLYFGGCNEVLYVIDENNEINIEDINKAYECNNILLHDCYNINNIKDILKNITKIDNIKLYEAKQKQVIKTYFEEIQA